MKIKKKSIIIPAFALLIGASLAGSVTGTIAWYQYSTRTNAAYLGVSGGTSGNLQMRIKGQDAWLTTLSVNDIIDYVNDNTLNAAGYGRNILPITSGDMDKDDAIEELFGNPIIGIAHYDNWAKADNGNFLRIPLQLRYVERDGEPKEINSVEVDDEETAEDVYLSDLLIQEDANSENADLSDAIRFHIHAYQDDLSEPDIPNPNYGDPGEPETIPDDHIKNGTELNKLISKQGGNTVVQGKLDLDGDGHADKGYKNGKKYGNFEVKTSSYDPMEEIVYGQDDPAHPENIAIQKSYHARRDNEGNLNYDVIDKSGEKYFDQDNTLVNATEDIYPAVAKESGAYDLTKLGYGGVEDAKKIGTTIAKDPEAANYDDIKDDYLNVEITIWVEGWQKFVLKTEPGAQPGDPDVEIYDSIWKTDFINAAFNVGFEFGVDGDTTTK